MFSLRKNIVLITENYNRCIQPPGGLAEVHTVSFFHDIVEILHALNSNLENKLLILCDLLFWYGLCCHSIRGCRWGTAPEQDGYQTGKVD